MTILKNPFKKNSLSYNSVIYFNAQVVIAVVGFLSSILIARKVGPYVTGQYTYLIWISTTLTSIATLGIPNALTKYIAEYTEKKQEIAQKLTGSLLLLSIFISIIAVLLLCLFTTFHVFPQSINSSLFYILSIALPFTIISTTLIGAFKGHRQYNTLLRVAIINSPTLLIATLVVLYFRPTLQGLIIYYLITSIFSLGLYIVFIRKRIPISLAKLPPKIFKQVIKYVIIVSGIILLDQIVWDRSEVLFLGHYSTPPQVAFYTLSYTLTTNVMTLFPGSILGVLIPHFSALNGQKNHKKIAETYQTVALYIGLIVAALVGGGIALASPFLYIVYGPHYIQMITVFKILLFTAGWASIASITANLLYGTTNPSYILKVGLILSITNIILDFIFIPHFGAIGAAIANGISQFFGGIIGIYYVAKKGFTFPIYKYIKIFFVTVFSSSITSIIINMFRDKNFLVIILGSAIFLFLFFLLSALFKLIKLSKISFINI